MGSVKENRGKKPFLVLFEIKGPNLQIFRPSILSLYLFDFITIQKIDTQALLSAAGSSTTETLDRLSIS